MKTTWEKSQQARGHIEIAIQRLAGMYPFHAGVLERFRLSATIDLETMGVTVEGDDVVLFYNAGFVLKLPMDQLIGVLVHEVHHVVLGHVLADPDDYTDQWARTVAEEVTVNEFVKEPLPRGVIRLRDFPSLPRMESTDRRYQRLMNEKKRMPLSAPGGHGIGDAGSGRGGRGRRTVDDHSIWQDALKDRIRSEAAIRAAIQDAAIKVGAGKVPAHLHNSLDAMGIGHRPGYQDEQLGAGMGSLPWIQLLRRYVGQHVRLRPDFRRPPRRFPALVGIIPGRRHQGGRPRIMAVIDTSGSMTPEMLKLISGELGRLAMDFEVTVAECDVIIHKVYGYKPIKSVTGRGGTDLRPPFEPLFLRRQRPDLVIYFTDGMGPAPEQSPAVPVIWCLTPGGEAPVTWGRVIQMADPPAEKTPDLDGKTLFLYRNHRPGTEFGP